MCAARAREISLASLATIRYRPDWQSAVRPGAGVRAGAREKPIMKSMPCAIIVSAIVAASASGQSYYQFSDGTVSFAKAAFADPLDAANWDIITSTVAITRSNVAGIYNPLVEEFYEIGGASPAGTLWYFGASVADVIGGSISLADFDVWEEAKPDNTPDIVGLSAVLYLQDDDAYVDLVFTQWGVGINGGGSFAYRRAIVPTPASLAALGIAGLLGARRRR